MALPVILVNSATGSDTAASGAGPATAVVGTLGRTRNAASMARVGFFEASAPDLSGVLTDGSHALYIGITTAGQRNFSSIASVKDSEQKPTGNVTNNSAVISSMSSTTGFSANDIVRVFEGGAGANHLYTTVISVDSGTQITVADTISGSASGVEIWNPKQVGLTAGQELNTGATDTAWAIGGKRASIGATTSVKLFENNAAAGDAMPGWAIEMESGHSETIAATITWRRDGDTTDGPITLRGTAGAATLPLLTFSNNGNAFSHGSRVYTRVEAFEMRNSNATKTASVALAGTLRQNFVVRNIKVSHSTDKFWRVMSGVNCYGIFITDCEFGHCADSAIQGTGANYRFIVLRSYIHDCGATGVVLTSGSGSVLIHHSIIADNAGDGITILPSSLAVASNDPPPCSLLSNVFYSNDGDGAEITVTSSGTGTFESLLVTNNIFAANGGYGLKFSGSGVTDALLANLGTAIRNNDFYGNTSGAHSPTLTLASLDERTLDPQFTDAANGNFSIGANLKALGFPTGAIGYSSTTSYLDIGAAQRAERPRARSMVGI